MLSFKRRGSIKYYPRNLSSFAKSEQRQLLFVPKSRARIKQLPTYRSLRIFAKRKKLEARKYLKKTFR